MKCTLSLTYLNQHLQGNLVVKSSLLSEVIGWKQQVKNNVISVFKKIPGG